MAYVMESRVQQLEQLYILEKLIGDKMFAHPRALVEYDRLMMISMNKNPTKWEDCEDETNFKISLNEE